LNGGARKNILTKTSTFPGGITEVGGAALIKLNAVKKYLPHSVLAGSVLALVCTLWSTYWSIYYATPWVEGWMMLRSFLTFWIVWSLAMSVILPAILSDEFSA